jgi:hypothetical protein
MPPNSSPQLLPPTARLGSPFFGTRSSNRHRERAALHTSQSTVLYDTYASLVGWSGPQCVLRTQLARRRGWEGARFLAKHMGGICQIGTVPGSLSSQHHDLTNRWMDRVAKETGGQHIDAETTDSKTYFRQIAEELRSSYELAYYPSNSIGDDTFRKIPPTETGRLNGTLPNGILRTLRRLIQRTCSAVRADHESGIDRRVLVPQPPPLLPPLDLPKVGSHV